MKNPVVYARDLYARFERPISSLSLIGGFVFDALTLRRVDQFWENIWVLGHLFVVAVCIFLINIEDEETIDPTDASKMHFWLVNILQFVFGGLLSTFLVFYFRSATLTVSWPFLLILAAAFVANERLKRHYARVVFQITLFYLSLFCFAIFIVPVIAHKIGPWIFLLSGAASLGLLWIFLAFLEKFASERFAKSKKLLWTMVFGIFALVNICYFTNIIPPIPLSLKDAGIYHTIIRDPSGDYEVTSEPESWWQRLFTIYDNFHMVYGDTAIAYSAVFSPSDLNTVIVYNWQHYNPDTNRWEDEGNVTLPVIGGREQGYRTYTEHEYLTKGRWRVNVETEQGQVIGRILFNVVPVDTEYPTLTEIKS